MKNGKLFLVTLTFIVLGTLLSSAQKNTIDPDIKKLDRYFSNARVQWEVPGMAIGIIRNNQVVLLKGYGVADVRNGKNVDGDTRFAVASNTKAFTATALGMLIDEGLLNWDDKVTDHLPWFRLYDPYVTYNLTIRDMLSHRSGLKTFSGDLIWYGSNHSREEIVRRAAFLKPHHGFREVYGYSNILYLAAGLIVEQLSGMSWDDFIKTRLFLPLQMTNSNTSTTDLDLNGNTSMPHNDTDSRIIAINYLNWDNIAPAGSINSSASDMLKWLQFQLSMGTVNGNALIKESTLRETWEQQITLKVSAFSQKNFPSTHFRGYGLGWSLMDYKGRKVISHSGGYDGFISYSAFIPEENLGYVILTNKNSSLFVPLSYTILDAFLGGEQNDWSTNYFDLIEKSRKQEEEQKAKIAGERVSGTSPSLPAEEYCGKYTSEIYGSASVEYVSGQLLLSFDKTPIFHGTLNHWHFDTYTIVFPSVPSLPEGTVNFSINREAKVTGMVIDVPNPDFDFTELDFIKAQ
jgi:CubicO group peptidase (beta-lactamase class C family)